VNENNPYIAYVICQECGYKWTALSPYGRERSEGYECPKCGKMRGEETK